jgi:O-antigen ligase
MGQVWMIQTLGEKIDQNFNAHNLYLELWGEMGVGGPLLFLVGIGLAVALAERRGRQRRPGSFARAAALAASASAASLMAYGVFDSQLAITQSGLNLLFGALLAVGLSA